MPIGQLVSLGIGSPADIRQLVLTGLMTSLLTPNAMTFTIPFGQEVDLVGNTVYALGPRIQSIEWTTAVANTLDISVDGTNFITIDTASGADTRNVSVTAIFLRPAQACKVVAKKSKKL